MQIGGCRQDFWGLTPKTIQIDFKAYEERRKIAAQDRWEIGAYVCLALRSSVMAVGFADENTLSHLPTFPENPLKNETEANSGKLTPEQIKAERERAWLWIQSL